MSDYSDDEYNNGQNNAKTDFIVNIDNYIASIDKYKKDFAKTLDQYWKPEYDTIEETLYDIKDTIDFNWLDAKTKAEQLPCLKYENFSQYVSNTDFKNTKHIKGTAVRAKTLRKKRNNKCPKCNVACEVCTDNDNDNHTLRCPKCGYEIVKEKAVKQDDAINNEKHVRKQLDKLVGLTKIPNNVKKLLPALTIWLTEWVHLRDWLIYANRIDDFINHYNIRTGKRITINDFGQKIERKEANKITFEEYELIVEEFYKLTEIAQIIARKSSNINEKDDVVIDIIKHYMDAHEKQYFVSFNDFPDENTIFEYKGMKYNIGVYLSRLGLVIDYDEHHIKHKIVKQFCKDGKDFLILPGLVYNYFDLFSLTDNIPRSFNYSENYNKIMNEVFHSQFSVIPPNDINAFVNIVLRFNDYYKKNIDRCGKKKDTKTNSPLFVCTIQNVITSFYYFHKYVNVLEQTPHRITDSVTKNLIDSLWLKFKTDPINKDLLETYDKYDDLSLIHI